MKINLLPYFVIFLFCLSCSKTIEPKDDVDALYQQFHGKYKIVSSYSNVAVDANLDGKESFDLMSEIPDLKYSDVYLRITKPFFYLDHYWQEQFIVSNTKIGILPKSYEPSMSVNFANQGAGKRFEFSSDLKKIIVNPYNSFDYDTDLKERFKNPESVTVEGNERLKIITNKWIFTRKGWINVMITSVYERYTMIT
jgi:hypothetical protein